MINNDILRSVRFIIDCPDNRMLAILRHVEPLADDDFAPLLKKDDDPAFRQVVGNYGVRTQFRGSQEYTAFARKAFEDEKKIVQNIGLED